MTGKMEMGAQRVDLHIHSTASDGALAPQDILKEAQAAHLAAIAIADHDITEGSSEALRFAEHYGLEVVPAVEINTDVQDREIHILGYYIDLEDEKLQERLAKLRGARLERGRKIVDKLNQLGLKIDLEEVVALAGNGSVGRPHIAQALVERRYVKSIGEAFERYIGRGGKAFVERYRITPQEAIAFVLEAGGLPVLAHPGNIGRDEFIPILVAAGLRGLEIHHPDHSSYQVEHYRQLAKKYGLLTTGGSDSHGPRSERAVKVGSLPVFYEAVNGLKEARGCFKVEKWRQN